jgi:hypothetical protein
MAEAMEPGNAMDDNLSSDAGREGEALLPSADRAARLEGELRALYEAYGEGDIPPNIRKLAEELEQALVSASAKANGPNKG